MPFDPNEWIFEIIAIYAAIISTFTLYYFYDQSRINVKVTISSGKDSGIDKDTVAVTAVNLGKKPVTVTVFGIITPEEKKIIVSSTDGKSSSPPLPTRLREGQVCTGYYDLKANFSHLYQFGKKFQMKGFFRDAEKRDYISEPIEVVLPTLPDNVKVLVRPEFKGGK
ncbi:MAG: hypothetical protein K6T66_08455 [Peptococcaceae bacterium]|nr:hypothetical protein [Peptococcaceae bacterium]